MYKSACIMCVSVNEDIETHSNAFTLEPSSTMTLREALKKTFFTLGEGGSGPVFVTLFFFLKTWSKMA